MKKAFAIIVMLLSSFFSAPATPQESDILIYKGKSYPMVSNPLETFYENRVRPNFMIRPHRVNSANWRGYLATWEIVNNELYLSEIDSYLCLTEQDECERVTLKALFGDRWINSKVKADWYTGDLSIGDGKRLFLKGTIEEFYERTITLKFKAGLVIGTTTTNNRKSLKTK